MKPRQRRLREWSFVLLVVLAVATILCRGRRSPRTTFDDGARVAYFIQVSDANLPLLPRLLVALYDPANWYALHLDRKIDEVTAHAALRATYQELGSRWGVGVEQNVPNLVVARSEVITYRGATMTMNYLTGANRLLAEGDWDYFVNLSGADYPTASQATIRKLLGKIRGCRNFVEWKPRSTWQGFVERRLGEFYVDTGLAKLDSTESEYVDPTGLEVSLQVPGGPRVANPLVAHLDYTVAKSSGWFILSRAFCEHLRGDSDARKMLAALAFSDASDEHFFATVLWNGGPRWRESVVPSNLRTIFFVAPNGSFALGTDGKRSRQHPFWVDDVDDAGKLLFWKELKKMPGFFTRKVRDGGDFRNRVDREMIGLGELGKNDVVKLREYEASLEARFDEVVRVADVNRHEELWTDEENGY